MPEFGKYNVLSTTGVKRWTADVLKTGYWSFFMSFIQSDISSPEYHLSKIIFSNFAIFPRQKIHLLKHCEIVNWSNMQIRFYIGYDLDENVPKRCKIPMIAKLLF